MGGFEKIVCGEIAASLLLDLSGAIHAASDEAGGVIVRGFPIEFGYPRFGNDVQSVVQNARLLRCLICKLIMLKTYRHRFGDPRPTLQWW